MWFEKLRSNKIDGLSPLLDLFSSEDEFIEHFFQNVKFFYPEVVARLSKDLINRIEQGESIPVRYSMKTKEYFHYKNQNVAKGISKKSFKNKEHAKDFALNKDYFHNETGIKVIFDKDGNYYVRNEIFKAVNYRVSQGAISDVKNYVISHIWGKTENPLFFTALWNVALVPNYLSFILDKSDENSEIVRKIKLIAKAICNNLYSPNTIIGSNYPSRINEDEFSEEIKLAELFLKNKIINFLSTHLPQKLSDMPSVSDPYDNLLELREIISDNKNFVLAVLSKLKSSNTEFISLFVDKNATKVICKMSFPILVDITGNTKEQIKQKSRPVNSDVYYVKPYFEFKSKQYLICNDWHNEHEELLLEWLTGIED